MVIELKNRDDIITAAHLAKWLNRPIVEKVIVSLPGLDQDRRVGLEKKLKFLFNDCGCLWAAPAFLTTFSFRFWSSWQAHGFSWMNLAVSFLTGACAAFTAKFIALAWSYRRLKTCFRRIGDAEAGREYINQEGGRR